MGDSTLVRELCGSSYLLEPDRPYNRYQWRVSERNPLS